MIYSLKILEKIHENKNACTLILKQPNLRKIKYKAGQYLTLTLNIGGRKYKRAYSFSSSPSIDENLKFTVKRVPNGVVSNYFLDNVNVGDTIEVLEPMGEFFFDKENLPNQVFLWAAGSGITPIYSILNELLNCSPSIQTYLTYVNPTTEESIFLSNLIDLSLKHKDRLKLNLFFSREDTSQQENSYSGRINSDFVKSYTLSCSNSLYSSIHFICGPSQMKKMVIESLGEISAPRETIFSEDFELTINEYDLRDVIDSEVELQAYGNVFKVLVHRGKTILDTFLDNGIDLPYSCQTGSCNTCKVKILSGETKMLGDKTRMNLDHNEILSCCSFPLTQKIQIEI